MLYWDGNRYTDIGTYSLPYGEKKENTMNNYMEFLLYVFVEIHLNGLLLVLLMGKWLFGLKLPKLMMLKVQ